MVRIREAPLLTTLSEPPEVRPGTFVALLRLDLHGMDINV